MLGAPAAAGSGFNPSDFGAIPVGQTAVPAPAPAPASPNPASAALGFAGGAIADQFEGGVNAIKAGLATPSLDSPVDAAEGALKTGSGIAAVLTSPLAPLFYPVNKAVGAIADAASNNPEVQQFAESPAGQTAARVAGDVSDAASIAGTVAGGEGAEPTIPEPGADVIAQNILKEQPAPAPTLGEIIANEQPSAPASAADHPIIDAYNKAIKPTAAGKTGPGQLQQYNGNIATAIKAIVANQDNLHFESDDGTASTGELPLNRSELADAVTQTKQVLFSKFDSLAKAANGEGAKVSLQPTGDALDDVINNQALQITNPEAVSYAKAVQDRLKNPDGTYKAIDPETTQQAVANLNSSLKAFYRNPDYNSASRAAIDSGAVYQLRQSLDSTIENATGEQYTGLKRQYGALSAIEKDVNKAAVAHAKQTGTNTSGLGKYVDVFAGGDMVHGLLSLHPAMFAKGAAQAGLSHFFQYLNSPDRAVTTMFRAAAKGR